MSTHYKNILEVIDENIATMIYFVFFCTRIEQSLINTLKIIVINISSFKGTLKLHTLSAKKAVFDSRRKKKLMFATKFYMRVNETMTLEKTELRL